MASVLLRRCRKSWEYNLRHILIVTDPGVIAAGLIKPVCERLDQSGVNFTVFSDVAANPKDLNVEAGTRLAREMAGNTWRYDVVCGNAVALVKNIDVFLGGKSDLQCLA